MRLKEDKSSWKSGGVIRRDERHAKDETKAKLISKRKDTKKWCKGKVGVSHTEPKKWTEKSMHVLEKLCTKCGKVLDWKVKRV